MRVLRCVPQASTLPRLQSFLQYHIADWLPACRKTMARPTRQRLHKICLMRTAKSRGSLGRAGVGWREGGGAPAEDLARLHDVLPRGPVLDAPGEAGFDAVVALLRTPGQRQRRGRLRHDHALRHVAHRHLRQGFKSGSPSLLQLKDLLACVLPWSLDEFKQSFCEIQVSLDNVLQLETTLTPCVKGNNSHAWRQSWSMLMSLGAPSEPRWTLAGPARRRRTRPCRSPGTRRRSRTARSASQTRASLRTAQRAVQLLPWLRT